MYWPKLPNAVGALLAVVLLVPALADESYLLPGHIVPYHYDLTLTYDIDTNNNFSYFGVVDIFLTCKHPTNKIMLHGKSFKVDESQVTVIGLGGSGPSNVAGVYMNDTYDFLTVYLDDKLSPNKNYTLTIPFSGNLQNDLDGVYISSYLYKHNKTLKLTEYLIATQFEAISARKGFPCFDEPIYKATFSLNVGHHQDYTAVSNMPLFNTTRENEVEEIWSWNVIGEKFGKPMSVFLWDQFETTVPMSTYLVAFVISKFQHVESPGEHTKFRIWARKDAISQTQYAAEIGPKVLSIFEKWFDVPFPLPKQDMVAIPDFSAGAMENWGLITYRETALLYDSEESSFTAKERVAEVIAHELAHQWFGNLVTMQWWSDLWLNEGFATYVGSLGVRGVEPQWRGEEMDAAGNMRAVLALDALETSHPVSVPIDDPKRIHEIFDEISYRKGALLIRMMTIFLGEDTFRKAIHNYLIKYSYQNAEQDDLWKELTDVKQLSYEGNNVTIKEIMDTWTKQTGYPLLTVNREYSNKSATIKQKRYTALGSESYGGVSWWVPLNTLCEKEEDEDKEMKQIEWLSKDQGTSSDHWLEHCANSNEWLLFNADITALYRVNYDINNWMLLTKTLDSDKYNTIPMLSRVQLLDDAFALAWSNVIEYHTALTLVQYLERESEYLPLETGLFALSKIENVLLRSPDYGAFQKFVRHLITKAYMEAGGLHKRRIINRHDLTSVKMQVLTSRWACRMKVAGCEDNAVEMFRDWMDVKNPDNYNPIPLDLRTTVYCVAMSRGSVQEWRFLFQRYQNANVAAAKTSAMLALACTKEVWILKQYLEWTVDEGNEVRKQDASSVFSSIARSSVGYYLARDFLYDRIQDMYTAFHGQSRRLGQMVRSVVEQFTTQLELDDFSDWQDKNQKYLDESKLVVSQAVEKARVNIAWLNKNRKIVVDKMRHFSQ